MINFVEFCLLNKKFTYNNDHCGEILIDRCVCSSVVHLQVYRYEEQCSDCCSQKHDVCEATSACAMIVHSIQQMDQ